MGTAKRERQKANRQLRLEELAKQARKTKTKRLGLRIGLLVGGVVVIVGLIYWVGGGSKSTSSAATATTGVGTTTTLEAIPAPTKPVVTKPATIPTKLTVTTITAGTGPKAKAGDFVRVYYVGILSATGKEFDSNYATGQTLNLTLGAGQVIKGWDQGLLGLQVGGRYQIDIPAALAYGSVDVGTIPANSALTFVVDIVKIVPGTATTDTTPPTT